ncbi:hypothetical protein [Cutibacterium avidum]|uniref:hypothetical protein n=1 Tax=Cutibacterium avidum TaxID=33010 RepID=UPI000AD9E532|nr:hypothetical protein [Cutibacterium avidum]
MFFTRSRPYTSNDQATIESKNNHLVRRYGFYYRYDTPTELDLLNQLWVVCDWLNDLTPTTKPIGWSTDAVGRRTRIYDQPRTPYQRLLDAGILSPAQQAELAAYKTSLKPVAMAAQITGIQAELTRLAAAKTRQLEDQTRPKLPPATGIRTRAS